VEAVFVHVLSKNSSSLNISKAGFTGLSLCPDFEMQTSATMVYRGYSNSRAIGRPEHCDFLPDLLETGNVACLPTSGRAETGKDSCLRV
jgi:hypothetical protein